MKDLESPNGFSMARRRHLGMLCMLALTVGSALEPSDCPWHANATGGRGLRGRAS